jgi:hypothetical protein
MRGGSIPVARVLAAAALAVALVAVVWIVSSSLGGDGEAEVTQPTGERNVIVNGCDPKADAAVKAGFYIVKPGEVLSLIAERTCSDEEDLIRLNPDLDPQALAPDQCINLKERGCEQQEQ